MPEIKQSNGLAINTVVSRQAEEVQAMVFMAKQFPRDQLDASRRIVKMCGREGLAKSATYTYPRGGQKITGPSIRLAEAVAQAWGNIDYGIIELNTTDGLSEMMAYAWDLETNVRRSMIFSVKHERDTKNGKVELNDNRDIYELIANMGARRVRACILGVIPGDIVDEAVAACQDTLNNGEKKTIDDSIKNMLANFETRFRISRQQIENYIGYPISNFDVEDLTKLRGVYNSLKDGSAKREDYFQLSAAVDALAEPEQEADHEPNEG